MEFSFIITLAWFLFLCCRSDYKTHMNFIIVGGVLLILLSMAIRSNRIVDRLDKLIEIQTTIITE